MKRILLALFATILGTSLIIAPVAFSNSPMGVYETAGLAADNQVASLTSALAAAQSSLTSSPSPTNTSPSPTPTTTQPTGFLLGSSGAQYPNAKVDRVYFSTAPSVYNNSIVSAVPSGEAIFVSFKYDVAGTVAGSNNAAFASVLKSWNASGRVIYWTWQHEADDPTKHIAQADFVNGWKQLLSVEAANPSSNVHSMSILMGTALTGVHGPIEGWYVSGVDYLGFDSYFTKTELLAEAYASGKGKLLAFPEFGDTVNPGQTDAQALAFAKAFIANLTPGVFGAAWFNSGNNTFSKFPSVQAYLNSIS